MIAKRIKRQKEQRSNDNKRLKTFDRITSYPFAASAGKVCKTELLSKVNIK